MKKVVCTMTAMLFAFAMFGTGCKTTQKNVKSSGTSSSQPAGTSSSSKPAATSSSSKPATSSSSKPAAR